MRSGVLFVFPCRPAQGLPPGRLRLLGKTSSSTVRGAFCSTGVGSPFCKAKDIPHAGPHVCV